jgi:hypothetical protein
MYGRCMADFAFITHSKTFKKFDIILPNNNMANLIEVWKIFTKKKMGHSCIESTEKYFNMSGRIEKYVEDIISENQKNILRFKNELIEIIQ